MTKIKSAALSLLFLAITLGGAHASCWQWSRTASSNSTADPSINWSEGMAPSAVNDSARAMMARLAECRDDLSGFLATTGTSTAYLVTTYQGTLAATPGTGQAISFRLNVTNGASPTLAADGGTAWPIQTSPGVAVSSGVLVAGTPYRVTFSGTAWLLQDFYNSTIAAGSVVTSMLADAAVTYAKIQNVATNRLLGNVSGGAAAPQEITIGGGLSVSGTTLSAPAYPPPGSFKNLAIKVTANTTLAVSADFVTTTNGTLYQTTTVSCTINMGTTGINALDTGSIASATWYYIWVNAKTDATTGCTASLQSTANGTFVANQPSGYTYYARVGAVRTAAGVAQLMGTWQFGRVTSYILGLAQTTVNPLITSGSAGNVVGPTWVANSISAIVPTTASRIFLRVSYGSNTFGLAPNNSYGIATSTTIPPPVAGALSPAGPFMIVGDFLLESTNIYYFSNSALTYVFCSGWEDNI